MGRPSCAVVTETIIAARTSAWIVCVGNRVYTGAADDEAYFAVPGGQIDHLVEKLEVIVRANQELETFHRGRAGGLPRA
jgi:uncharacterized protein (DUF169 family)